MRLWPSLTILARPIAPREEFEFFTRAAKETAADKPDCLDGYRPVRLRHLVMAVDRSPTMTMTQRRSSEGVRCVKSHIGDRHSPSPRTIKSIKSPAGAASRHCQNVNTPTASPATECRHGTCRRSASASSGRERTASRARIDIRTNRADGGRVGNAIFEGQPGQPWQK
jgi:hypothetical protein